MKQFISLMYSVHRCHQELGIYSENYHNISYEFDGIVDYESNFLQLIILQWNSNKSLAKGIKVFTSKKQIRFTFYEKTDEMKYLILSCLYFQGITPAITIAFHIKRNHLDVLFDRKQSKWGHLIWYSKQIQAIMKPITGIHSVYHNSAAKIISLIE